MLHRFQRNKNQISEESPDSGEDEVQFSNNLSALNNLKLDKDFKSDMDAIADLQIECLEDEAIPKVINQLTDKQSGKAYLESDTEKPMVNQFLDRT